MNKKILKRKAKFILGPLKQLTTNTRYRLANQYANYYENSKLINNTILYESRDGNSMTDNPYAMFEYMLHHPSFKEYTHIWSIADFDLLASTIARYEKYPNVKFVKRNSKPYLKYLATSKYLINNSTFQSFYTPKEGQVYINTWHGTPLKSMGFDIPGNPSHSQNVVRNFLSTSYLLSPNPHTTNMYTKSYKLDGLYEGTIIEEGYPRIDMTLNTDSKRYREYLRGLNLDIIEGKETILYAPTWKGTNVSKASNDTKQIIADMAFLKEKIGNQYNLLVKVHPYLYKVASQFTELKDILVPDFIDPNELLSTVDLLITDYSSIFFDYLVTDKPILFYTWDADVYAEERGQYLTNDRLPGATVYNAEELAEAIQQIDSIHAEFKANYQALKEQFTKYEDGRVTERVVQYIFGLSTQKLNCISNLSRKKEKILIYPGGMRNNGITSSFINLMDNIDFDEFDVTCFMGTPHNQEALKNIEKVNKNVRFLFKPGYPIYQLSEIYKDQFIHNRGERGYWGKKLYPEKAYRRERKRLYGLTHFDYVIDFSGYSHFWAKYLLAIDAKQKLCYMHNDLLSESEKVINKKRPHRINLRGLFSVYHRFDKLVSVSEGTMELNRKNLSEYADYDKFTFICNSINPDKILNISKVDHAPDQITLSGFKSERFVSRGIITQIEAEMVWNTLPGYLNVSEITLDKDYEGAEILISRMATDGETILYRFSIDHRIIGWINAECVEVLPDSIVYHERIDKLAVLHKPKGNDIWSKPYKVEGIQRVSTSTVYKNIMVHLDEVAQTQHSMYYHFSINGSAIGWIDQAALKVLEEYTITETMSPIQRKGIESKRKRILKNNYKQHLRMVNGIENRTLREYSFNRLYATISYPEDHVVWTKAYPNVGVKKVGAAREYEGKLVRVRKGNRTRTGTYYLFYDMDQKIGWLDRHAFEIVEEGYLLKEADISKLVEIHLHEDLHVWNQPYGLVGAEVISDGAELNGMLVKADKEAVTIQGTYLHLVQDEKPIGWINKDGVIIKQEYGLTVKQKFIPFPREEDINFVNMGRLSPEKGQDNLIKAFADFHQENSNSKLYILGQGVLEDELRALIHELGMQNAVYLLGQQENPFDFLRKCDCFVLSSHYEGQPMVLLEAMTLGMDIIATDIVANRTVLEGGKYGLLVENSIDGLVSGMKQVAGSNGPVGASFDSYKYNHGALETFYECLGYKKKAGKEIV